MFLFPFPVANRKKRIRKRVHLPVPSDDLTEQQSDSDTEEGIQVEGLSKAKHANDKVCFASPKGETH